MKATLPHWKLILVVFCALLIVGGSTTLASAEPDRAQGAIPSKLFRSESSLLLVIDLTSGDYEVAGLYDRMPMGIERVSSQTISQGAFAVVILNNGESFLKPVLVRDVGDSKVKALVPFSASWGVAEIALANIPAEPGSAQVIKAISLSGEALSEHYSELRDLRADRLGSVVSPKVSFPPDGPLIDVADDCFVTHGGCLLCYFCAVIFRVELCQQPIATC